MVNNPNCKHPDLLADIEAFCAKHNVARTRFGKEAVRDPSLVVDLEKGRELRSRTLDLVRAFMARPRTEAMQEAAE